VRHQVAKPRADCRPSDRLKRAVFDARFNRVRQSQLAIAAGFHPTTLSAVLHDALPIRRGDARLIRLGGLVGVSADDCFEEIQRRAFVPLASSDSATAGNL
jgi:hypothetical protein